MIFQNTKILCRDIVRGVTFKKVLFFSVMVLIIQKTAGVNLPPMPDWSQADFTNLETFKQSIEKQVNFFPLSLSLSLCLGCNLSLFIIYIIYQFCYQFLPLERNYFLIFQVFNGRVI